MSPLAKIAAFGSAAVGTAAAASLAWVAITRGPQASRKNQPADQSTSGDAKMTVCVASDSVFRRPKGDDCPPGQTRLNLDEAETKVPNCSACDTGTSKKPRLSNRALADIERRLNNVEKSPLFTVVDAEGHPMFAVTPEAISIYSANNVALVAIGATGEGGFFRAMSDDGALAVSVGASGMTGGVRLREEAMPRLELGKQEIGTYSLKVRTPNALDAVIAGIGESRSGTGALIVGDVQGRLKASLVVAGANGMIGIYNNSGAAVLSLTEGATRGGLLAIADRSGAPMVKMGVKDDRYGVVLAGPVAGFPLVTGSGLPGSYILGCAGGGACVP